MISYYIAKIILKIIIKDTLFHAPKDFVIPKSKHPSIGFDLIHFRDYTWHLNVCGSYRCKNAKKNP